ncbi:class I SAM-dependent methyltransferase [Roseicyclus mahoneyensis]|uniref:Methyltransferase family protein n=1 Tax=Roseicyclus mahoneyensis TaxID=164332 RepID=A0A316GG67_9RHOB|nr:class I SAM-dependent methyltransferase [Roseicyclus mahoneyensis]PWK59645.1 methyltransferase family protein [Roseicyclus mahoneyensis]
MTPQTRLLYAQDALPVFQNRMYDSAAEGRDCPKGDMRLVEDLETGLVHNAAFNPEFVDYDAAYQNEQAGSPQFRAHMDAVADLVEDKMGRTGLIEVGCGKGTFLELLSDRGAKVTGFDPTYEGDSPLVKRAYFSPGLGLRGEGLILRHVLEHIPDPVAFLRKLAEANGGRGLIYIEVPCLDWICTHKSWFDIFFEHVNYFRLTDFNRIFARVVHADRAFGGQYLRVVADLSTLRTPRRDAGDTVRFPDDITARLKAQTETGGPDDIVWGGASKGVIFSLLRERAGRPVGRVIDINPAKQGRYLPATGLRVLSPDEGLRGIEPGATILVMNPNYLDEIRQMTGNAFTYVGVSA